jgi:predicted permease
MLRNSRLASRRPVRDSMNPARLIESIWQDVHHALRLFRRRPGTTVTAILSLTLGVGVNTLAFSVVHALVLAPLPVERPDELVFVQTRDGFPGHSFPNYRDFRDRNDSFAGLTGYRISPMSVEIDRAATRAWGYLATGNYFQVLGIEPALGRLFRPDDDGPPGTSPFAVLSYDAWQTRFAGDPQVVWRTLHINRLPYTILGVTPRGFHGTEIFYRPEIWVPMAMQAQIEVGNPWLDQRSTFNTWVVGRLRPGVTAARAESNMNAIAATLAREHPGPNRGLAIRLTRPGLVGDTLRSPVRAFTLGLLLLAALVLVAGCANIASLLVAQGTDRRREMALRASIGAGTGRLVRQVLTETVVL